MKTMREFKKVGKHIRDKNLPDSRFLRYDNLINCLNLCHSRENWNPEGVMENFKKVFVLKNSSRSVIL